ncbi:hypothetical protein Dsin_022630 [Dipteronia sinensis]|uniref:Uncharacterized protein n=1 Tax=Dipteronia sinensis TaxID=43782 RepID=A0AAE0A1W0_9ROSI|nr:hypothetical protein Dsin_022630 [Dipteronia sinensis]
MSRTKKKKPETAEMLENGGDSDRVKPEDATISEILVMHRVSMEMETRGDEGTVCETSNVQSGVIDNREKSVTKILVSHGSENASNMDLSAGQSLSARRIAMKIF